MIATAIHTKWKFIVEFEDEETATIAGRWAKLLTAMNARC